MLGHKITPPHSRFIGHKTISSKNMGQKFEPKNNVTATIYSHSPDPKINNQFNSPQSHIEPIKKYIRNI